MSIPGTVDSAVELVLMPQDANEDLYPQAEIFAAGSNTPLATIDMSHIHDGRYEGNWTPSTVGAYVAVFHIYTDAAHTIDMTPLVYSREVEQLFISSSSVDDLASKITRILGLTHENAYIDMTEFDDAGQLISARVRIFPDKANALAATDGGFGEGELETFSISSDYQAPGRMKTYRMVRD